MKMPDAQREDWLVQLTMLNGRMQLEIRSEYAIRRADGGRIVVQGLPPFVAPVANIADLEVTLSDGHVVTVSALVEALRDLARDTVDAFEAAPATDIISATHVALDKMLEQRRPRRPEIAEAQTRRKG